MSLNEATEIKASFKTANFFLTQFTSCLALKYHKSRPRSFLVPVFVLFFLVSAWSRIHKSWADNKVTLQTSILSMCVVVQGKTDCSWNGVKQLSGELTWVELLQFALSPHPPQMTTAAVFHLSVFLCTYDAQKTSWVALIPPPRL